MSIDTTTIGIPASIKLDGVDCSGYISNGKFYYESASISLSDIESDIALLQIEAVEQQNDQFAIFVNSTQSKLQQIVPEGSVIVPYQHFGKYEQYFHDLAKYAYDTAEKAIPNENLTLHSVSKIVQSVKVQNGSMVAKLIYKYESLQRDSNFGALCVMVSDQTGDNGGNVNNQSCGAFVITSPDKYTLFKSFGL